MRSSTTPLKPLGPLNCPAFVEAAQVVAQRVPAGAADDAARLRFAFRLVTARPPSAAEEGVDVAAAVDTALAGLVLARAAGTSLETAAHFANAAAGVVVGKLGTATAVS